MNKVLTLTDVANLIAQRTGLTQDKAHEALKSMFADRSARLAAGSRDVKLGDIGHIIVDNNGTPTLSFVPSKTLSDAVNEPFAMFEAVEIPEDAQQLVNSSKIYEEPKTAPVSISESNHEPVSHPEPAVEFQNEPESAVEPEQPEPAAETEQPESINEIVPESSISPVLESKCKLGNTPQPYEKATWPETIPTPQELANDRSGQNPDWQTEDIDNDYNKSEHRLGAGFSYILGILTGIVISCVAVYFIYPKLIDNSIEKFEYNNDSYSPDDDSKNEDKIESSAMTEPSNTQEENFEELSTTTEPQNSANTPSPNTNTIPTKTTSDIVYTIKPGDRLATIARQYYGVPEFWVCIFEENKIIKKPNELNKGWKIVIPPAEKYGYDASNPASVAKAKEKARELNQKFK